MKSSLFTRASDAKFHLPRILLAVLISTFTLLTGCEREADLTHTSSYQKNGFSFSLPGNWEVKEDVQDEGYRYLLVSSPGDAMLIITQFQHKNTIKLRDYIDGIINSSSAEMPIGEREEGKLTAIERKLSGNVFKGYVNDFNISLAGISVPHTAEFFDISNKETDIFLFTQVSNEDRDKVKEGFDLVLSTFNAE